MTMALWNRWAEQLEIGMSGLSREELEVRATHFGLGDSEYIQHRSVESAVRGFAQEQGWDELNADKSGEIGPLEVDCYEMHKWTPERISYWADDLVEFLIDKFHDDEDLCGEDGIDSICISKTEELKEHARQIMSKFSEYAPPQTLRYIGTIHLPADEVTKIIESMNQAPV